MLTRIFRQAHGQILKTGARINSSFLVSASFGHATTRLNTMALRIAAEGKNYDAVEAMLDISCESTLPSPISFLLGADWDRVGALAKDDFRLAGLLKEYDRKSDAAMDEMMEGADMGGGLFALQKPPGF